MSQPLHYLHQYHASILPQFLIIALVLHRTIQHPFRSLPLTLCHRIPPFLMLDLLFPILRTLTIFHRDHQTPFPLRPCLLLPKLRALHRRWWITDSAAGLLSMTMNWSATKRTKGPAPAGKQVGKDSIEIQIPAKLVGSGFLTQRPDLRNPANAGDD